jgi:hypothetical protein
MRSTYRWLSVGGVLALLLALIALYFLDFLYTSPPTLAATVQGGSAHLTLQTVASYGHGPDPDWVSYLGEDSSGRWQHTTIYQVPAHSLVTITINQYDTATGLRNNFMGQVRGTVGGTATLNGKPYSMINPDDTSHTFSVPELGISVPLPGIDSNAKNQCTAAPCTLAEAHNSITFSFRTAGPGTFRWQCFVPCALATYFGNGGPMQTLGWMDGYIKVV